MKTTDHPRWDAEKRIYIYEDERKKMDLIDKVIITVCIVGAIAVFTVRVIWG